MRLGWKVLIPFSLVWILVVASFRELTNEGKTRLETLAYVGIPIAALVLIWSFVTESRMNKRAQDLAAEQAQMTARRAGDYPIPMLAGVPTVDVAAVSASSDETTEVLDV
jgi:NADH-quinone oxidoreductase subunit H